MAKTSSDLRSEIETIKESKALLQVRLRDIGGADELEAAALAEALEFLQSQLSVALAAFKVERSREILAELGLTHEP